jgi:ergothioneine biosynthesis protein EgtB
VRARIRSSTDVDRDRRDLAALYERTRSATEQLCAALSPEVCTAQSMPEASPVKWHLAHTSWFFETFVLAPHVPGYQPFHPDFGYLFNSYYNAIGERIARAERGLLARPTLEEVMSYRRHVDERMRECLARTRALDDAVVELGCHHEQQHQELILTDVKHLLSRDPLQPAFRAREAARRAARPAARAEFIAYDEGLHEIGHAGEGFAFDNESPRHRVFVHAFELADRPVTAGEFVEFITDHGYERPELWLSDGWDAVALHGWRAPLYWEKDGDRWMQFTLAGLRDVDPDEPACHVSYYEADAFARWAGARLPREAEWEIAARDLPIEGHFVESGELHPCATEAASERDRPRAMFGDVWEWTRSAYDAYPGYRPAEGALGEYNGKFMVNQMVLRGGSCASPRAHLRASYRNFFHPHARWQFSGIRLARDA